MNTHSPSLCLRPPHRHRWSAPHLTRSPPGHPPCTISHGPLCYHPERDRKESTVQNLICSVQLWLAAIWLHGTAWHFDDARRCRGNLFASNAGCLYYKDGRLADVNGMHVWRRYSAVVLLHLQWCFFSVRWKP